MDEFIRAYRACYRPSEREALALRLCREGRSRQRVAEEMGITRRTVDGYLRRGAGKVLRLRILEACLALGLHRGVRI